MAFAHGKAAAVYVEGYNLSSYLRSVDFGMAADVGETTCMGSTSKSYIAGVKDATCSAEGFFDGSTGAVDAVLSTAFGSSTDSLVIVYQTGDAAQSDPGWAFRCIESGYKITAPVDGVVSVSAEFQPSSDVDRIISLHPLAARTSAADGTSINESAGSSNGCAAILMVTAFTGTNITVKVQHSTNNSVWADLISFTAVTAANAHERKTTSSTVNQYIRASWSGTFTSATFAVAWSRK